MRRITVAGSALLAAALAPLVVLTGCAEGGGVRVEGRAPTAVVNTTPSPEPTAPAEDVDSVALVQNDPKISSQIKSGLKPCGGHEYPIDTSYGYVTHSDTPDVVINVSTCGDGVGLGSYVYRMENGQYVEIFGDEQPPVWLDIDKGDLQLTRQVYSKDDAVCCPSGEDEITYRWTGKGFAEISRTHSDYGKKTNG